MTTSIPEYAQYIVDQLKAPAASSLALSDVYYGDQNNIPRHPTVCVDTGMKRNELNGAPRRVKATIEVYVMIYHYKVASTETNQKGADELAEAVENFLHADPTMGGKAIHSLVTANESGYATRDKATYRTSRLTLEIQQQKMLPLPN